MTREEAKEALSVLKIYDNQWLREAIDMAIEALSADTEWIPCSERLPEEGVNVLLCIKDWESQKTKMVVSLRRDYNYWDGLGRDIRGDIAWMPLPEPYKGGDAE